MIENCASCLLPSLDICSRPTLHLLDITDWRSLDAAEIQVY